MTGIKVKQLKNYHLIEDVAALNTYSGPRTSLLFPDGRAVIYSPASTDQIDNFFVFGATGKGVGRWISPTNGPINVKEIFKAKGDGVTDDTLKLQQAIDAGCPRIGGPTKSANSIFLPAGTYLITDILDLTNTRQNGTLSRDGIIIEGEGTLRTKILCRTGAGKAGLDITGSQWLRLSNLSLITDGAAGSSTLGIFAGCGSVLPQTQNQSLFQVSILMHDDITANSGMGTIGYLGIGSEENTLNTVYIQANCPAIFTAYTFEPYVYAYPRVALLSAHSMGVTTFSGECALIGMGGQQPALQLEDINSFQASNLYLVSTLPGGQIQTQHQAIRIRGGASNCHVRGTIEGFSGCLQVFGRAEYSDFYFEYGTANVAAKPVILLEQGEGNLDKCKIRAKFNDGSDHRPFWKETTLAPNQVASCFVKDTEVSSNELLANMMLPEKVAWHRKTSNTQLLVGDTDVYKYESGQQLSNIAQKTIRGYAGANPTTKIAAVQLATTIAGTSAMTLVFRLEGAVGHNIYVSGESTALYLEGTVTIAISQNGAITVGAPVTTILGAVASNAPGNSLTDVTLTTAIVGNTVEMWLTPVVSGINNEPVYFVGNATLRWMGHSCNAPCLKLS